jgi:hypothetical protein
MANVVDNLLAFKILYMLVTPFDKTEAFKRGVIDKDGTVLVKVKDQTPEQKEAYDLLDRLVFSLKRLLGKLPGGKSQIASLAAAYYLVKESYEGGTSINEQRVKNMLDIIEEGVILVEEQLTVLNFIKLYEEGEGGAMPVNAIANKVGASVSTDIPVIKVGKNKKPTPIARRKPLGVKEVT